MLEGPEGSPDRIQIEDLKCYFDDPDSDEEDEVNDVMDGPGLLLFSRGAPRNRADLLAQLPERAIADRLITRYFSSMSPSQHILHRPTFARTYAQFHQDPSSVTLHWVAQLFMMLALGVHFNSFQAPHEIEGDSPVPASDRIRHYRSCAGWALVWGKYTQPNSTTLPALMLYVESHFLFNRGAQMNCYVLSGVLVRLMLKMGLHRDPSKLAGLSAFEGEMRRRMWNMGIQIETIVSFHMGLPSMMQSIETDTNVPRNLKDEDFDTDTLELPPSRPPTDYTTMTYPVSKTKIVHVFGQIARQAHGLTPPPYSEVLRLDTLLQETWKNVPNFMMVRPLDDCVGDPPTLLIQRFGLRSLYNKSRCVLHRRYLAESPPNKEHDYSRQQCLEGAVSLMETQGLIWEACRPARSLAHHGWFISSLSVHDYLLAAMVLYLIIQNEHYDDASSGIEWTTGKTPKPTKDELKEMIKRSHQIWLRVSQTTAEVRKTADTLAVMLAKLGLPVDENSVSTLDETSATQTVGSESGLCGGSGSSIMPHSSISNFQSTDPLSTMSFDGTSALTLPGMSETDVKLGPLHSTDQIPFSLSNGHEEMNTMSFPGIPQPQPQPQPNHPDELPSAFDFHPSWFPASDSDMDWVRAFSVDKCFRLIVLAAISGYLTGA